MTPEEKISAIPGAELKYIVGVGLIQAEGLIDVKNFYFRAKYDYWQFHVMDKPIAHAAEDIFPCDGYFETSGWMTKDGAADCIIKAVEMFRNSVNERNGE